MIGAAGCSEPFKPGINLVSSHRQGNGAPLAVHAAVLVDKVAGVSPIVEVDRYAISRHADGDVVAEFEMEMCWVHAKVRANTADLLSAFDSLADLHQDCVEVAVQGVAVFDFPVGGVAVSVAGDDHISPSGSDIVSESNDAVADGKDRSTEIRISTSTPVPVFTEVLGLSEA